MTFPCEFSLLRSAVRRELEPPSSLAAAERTLALVDWSRLLWLGRAHGVLPHVHRLLQHLPASLCPGPIRDQLKSLREVILLHSLARSREMCQVQRIFTGLAIPALATDPWMSLRAFGANSDLLEPDHLMRFLVPAADKDRVGAALLAAGHPPEMGEDKLIAPGCMPVRLNSRLGRHTAAARLWRDSRVLDVGGVELRHPAPAAWLLVRASHWPRSALCLIDAFEVALLCRQLSASAWADVTLEARAFDVEGPLRAMVAASHAALEMPLPPGLPGTAPSSAETQPAPTGAPSDVEHRIAAPFLPTPHPVVERMLHLAGTTSADFVCDLGCGDGRIAIKAATLFGARATGVDRDPIRIAEAVAHAATKGVTDTASFTCGDLFSADLSGATVITCYLLPVLQPPLLRKLHREARPGTRIVSHEFIFPGWPPERTEIIRVGPHKVSQIYLWRMP